MVEPNMGEADSGGAGALVGTAAERAADRTLTGRASLMTLLALTRQIQAQNEQQLADGRDLRAALDGLRAALPEAYVPRREVEQRLAGMTRTTDDLDKRLVAQEEWRIAQTREDGVRSTAVAGEIERSRSSAAALVAAAEKARSAQVMSWLMTGLIGLVTLLGSYILAHLPR